MTVWISLIEVNWRGHIITDMTWSYTSFLHVCSVWEYIILFCFVLHVWLSELFLAARFGRKNCHFLINWKNNIMCLILNHVFRQKLATQTHTIHIERGMQFATQISLECKIVHICWRTGNLKKTYPGNIWLPKYEHADVWMPSALNIGSRSSNGCCRPICTIIRSQISLPLDLILLYIAIQANLVAKVQTVIQNKFNIPATAVTSIDTNTFNGIGVVNGVQIRIWWEKPSTFRL